MALMPARTHSFARRFLLRTIPLWGIRKDGADIAADDRAGCSTDDVDAVAADNMSPKAGGLTVTRALATMVNGKR
jgi:hypothetical protein